MPDIGPRRLKREIVIDLARHPGSRTRLSEGREASQQTHQEGARSPEAAEGSFCLTRFLDANRPPLRLKTLFHCTAMMGPQGNRICLNKSSKIKALTG